MAAAESSLRIFHQLHRDREADGHFGVERNGLQTVFQLLGIAVAIEEGLLSGAVFEQVGTLGLECLGNRTRSVVAKALKGSAQRVDVVRPAPRAVVVLGVEEPASTVSHVQSSGELSKSWAMKAVRTSIRTLHMRIASRWMAPSSMSASSGSPSPRRSLR